MLQGVTQAIGAGLSQATVVGTFPATYEVGLAPGWVTAWRVTSKTAAGFTIDFANPAPAGGSTFDWVAGTADSPSSSSVQTMTAGATTITIPGTFTTFYRVAVGPGRMTDCDVVSKAGG